MTNLAPVPSESSTCPNCSAPLVADQRYCLSCGQPTSPVRLAFLDVLETEHKPQPAAPGGMVTAPVPYASYVEPAAGPLWLRRYAPLFGVLSVLLLAMIIGLLVGHWVTQSKTSSAPQVIKVEGLGALGAASTTPTSTSATSTTPATGAKSATSAKSAEAKEEAEAKAEEKAEEKAPAKAPEAKKVSSSTITKLEKSTGKTHEKELSKLSTAPIEVK
jgi:hypothetical protein